MTQHAQHLPLSALGQLAVSLREGTLVHPLALLSRVEDYEGFVNLASAKSTARGDRLPTACISLQGLEAGDIESGFAALTDGASLHSLHFESLSVTCDSFYSHRLCDTAENMNPMNPDTLLHAVRSLLR